MWSLTLAAETFRDIGVTVPDSGGILGDWSPLRGWTGRHLLARDQMHCGDVHLGKGNAASVFQAGALNHAESFVPLVSVAEAAESASMPVGSASGWRTEASLGDTSVTLSLACKGDGWYDLGMADC